MRSIKTIAWHEFITNVRRPGFILVTLLPPLIGLVLLIVSAFFSGQAGDFFRGVFSPETKPVGIVDQSQLFGTIPAQYAGRFVASADEAAAKRALLANELNGYVVIPRDYLTTGKLTSYTKSGGGFAGSSVPARADLSRLIVANLLAGKVDAATIARVNDPTGNAASVALDAKGNPTESNPLSFAGGFIVPYFLSVFLIIAIFISSSYLLRSVSEEKETRVMEIIVSSVSATELLAGKVIGLGALGMLQVGIWLLSAFAFSGGIGLLAAGVVIALNPAMFLLAVVYFILGYLMYAIIMATAGSVGTTQRESQQLAGIFSFAAAVPYMLTSILFTNPSAGILRVLSFFPFTAPTMMMLRLPLGNVPVEDIVGSIVVLLISLPIILWAGAKIFRMGLLMYGKRLALGQMVRALREA